MNIKTLRSKAFCTAFGVLYSACMQTLFRYLELILTAVGVVVVIAVFAIFHHIAPWEAAAICAVAVSVIHGLIFFGVRSAQRNGRNSAVCSIRTTLDQLMNQKLDVQLFPSDGEPEDWKFKAQRAVWEIQARLNYIEAESIKMQKMN
jgi:predicted membrane channel-forming protein YqfA (hemolysin III family)